MLHDWKKTKRYKEIKWHFQFMTDKKYKKFRQLLAQYSKKS